MIWTGIVLGIIVFESIVKEKMDRTLTFHKSIKKWNGKIILNKYYNKGAALDLCSKHPKLLLAMTGGLIVYIILSFKKIIRMPKQYTKKLACALLLGGALSNFIDRIIKHHVVDYFSFSWKKIRHIVFNIADLCIFLGSILWMLVSFKEKK